MKKNTSAPGSASDFEKAAAAASADAFYVLRLYVAGISPRSTKAIVNVRKICEEHLSGRYDLEVIDVCLHPAVAGIEQIIAAPTLIKKLPQPLRRFIGDMSQTDRLLIGLDIHESSEGEILQAANA